MALNNTQARRIASEWHGGIASELYRFTSTGAFDELDLSREITDCIKVENDRTNYGKGDPDEYTRNIRNLLDLYDYARVKGSRGPQKGWNQLAW